MSEVRWGLRYVNRIVLALCILLFSLVVHSQTEDDYWDEAYSSYEKKAFNTYYLTLECIEEFYKRQKQYQCIHLIDDMYILKPKNREDSIFFRKYLGYHAFYVERYCKNLHKAKELYTTAFHYLRSPKELDENSWFIEKRLASIHAQLNDREQEIYYLKLVEAYLVSKGETSKLLRTYSDLGSSYLALGDMERALSVLHEAFDDSDPRVYPKSCLSIGLTLMELNDHDNISEFENKVLKALKNLEVDRQYHERYFDYYIVKAKVSQKSNHLELAITYLEKAIERAKITKRIPARKIAKADLQLAALLQESQRYSEVKPRLDSACNRLILGSKISDIDLMDRLWPENTFASMYELYGDWLVMTHKNTEEAIKAYNNAIYINMILHQGVALDVSKKKSLAYHKELINKYVDATSILYEKGDIMAAINLIAKIEKKARNQNILQNKTRSLKLFSLSDKDRASIETVQDSIKEMVKYKYPLGDERYLNLISRLTYLANVNSAAEDVRVKNHSNLISYIVGDRSIACMYYTDSDTLLHFTSKDLVDQNLCSIHKMLNDASWENVLRDSLLAMTNYILPWELQEKVLTIVQDDFLHTLPFDLLIHQGDYLIKKVNLRYSLSIVGDHQQRKELSPEKLSVTIVSSEFEKIDCTSVYASSRSELLPLQYVSQEVSGIKEAVDRTSAVDELKGEDFFIIEKLKPTSVLHYIGHAKAFKDRSMLLHQQLNAIDTISDDQLIYLNTNYDLVVLSACETGLGQFESGDGIKSLSNAFIQSGSSSVLYSQWLADDLSSAHIMKYFYHNLASGRSKSEALRMAKLSYLEEAHPLKRHPYYWANFCIVGDDRPLVKKSNELPYLLGMGLLYSCFTIFLFLKT